MPKGVYKREGTGNGFQKEHAFMGGGNAGKHWKIKDTSKMSKAKMGNINGFKKGDPKPENAYSFPIGSQINKGRKLSEEHKRKIGRAGENNGMWKGGITPENHKIRTSIEFRLWREAIFARDNWTCQKYGTKGGKLHPHHIQNFAEYPELRFAIGNGITFSEKAHKEFHKIYGKKNNSGKQLKEFLK